MEMNASPTLLQLRFVFLFSFLLSLPAVTGYNVLFVSNFASRSHRHVLDEVAEALGTRGNTVTFLTSIKELRPITGVTSIHLPKAFAVMDVGTFSFFNGTMEDPVFFASLLQMAIDVCNVSLHEPAYQALMAKPRGTSGYDVMVVDAIFNECALVVAFQLGIPTIYLSPGIALPGIVWHLNIPTPLAYFTTGVGAKQHDLGFWDRARNAMDVLEFVYFRDRDYMPRIDKLFRKYVPDAPPVAVLEQQVSMLMTNTHVSVFPSLPKMPYFFDLGCLNCKEAKKLPKEIDDFLSGSGPHGAIYFSLGSYTKGNAVPQEMRNKLVEAFSKIPQRVLWKFEDEIPNLPKNVKLVKWAAQQDIIVHPLVYLFITHGGGLSMLEAAYHGIPLLGFPLAGDQLGNIAHAIKKGFGEGLEWKTFTADDLIEVIHRMITDKKYKTNALKLSTQIRDQPQDPKQLAAYYIEYVARHKGAPHLKSGADRLNIYQYLLLDVIGAVILVLVVAFLIIVFTIKLLFQLLFSGAKPTKNKKKIR